MSRVLECDRRSRCPALEVVSPPALDESPLSQNFHILAQNLIISSKRQISGRYGGYGGYGGYDGTALLGRTEGREERRSTQLICCHF